MVVAEATINDGTGRGKHVESSRFARTMDGDEARGRAHASDRDGRRRSGVVVGSSRGARPFATANDGSGERCRQRFVTVRSRFPHTSAPGARPLRYRVCTRGARPPKLIRRARRIIRHGQLPPPARPGPWLSTIRRGVKHN